MLIFVRHSKLVGFTFNKLLSSLSLNTSIFTSSIPSRWLTGIPSVPHSYLYRHGHNFLYISLHDPYPPRTCLVFSDTSFHNHLIQLPNTFVLERFLGGYHSKQIHTQTELRSVKVRSVFSSSNACRSETDCMAYIACGFSMLSLTSILFNQSKMCWSLAIASTSWNVQPFEIWYHTHLTHWILLQMWWTFSLVWASCWLCTHFPTPNKKAALQELCLSLPYELKTFCNFEDTAWVTFRMTSTGTELHSRW